MRKFKVSIVIPVYKPEEEIFKKVKEMLKKQTIKAEIVENWNMPEVKSINTGIKRANGDIIVTLAQDCIPENEFWLEKLVSPLKNKNVVATVSDLLLPEHYWKKYPFFLRIVTLNERNILHPSFDMRACAYRKKDLMDVGLINEDPKIIGVEIDTITRLKNKGKIVRANAIVFHVHNQKNFKDVIKKLYIYSEGNGKVVRKHSKILRELGEPVGGFWLRIIRATPLLGIMFIVYRFPFKKYFYLFPFYAIIAILPIHLVNILGFWRGFFVDRESMRNKEVLEEINTKLSNTNE